MNKKEEINYLGIISTKCDCCGEFVNGYYCKDDQWWDKYIESDEKNICLGCIADRGNFRSEYHRLVGMSVPEGKELYGN